MGKHTRRSPAARPAGFGPVALIAVGAAVAVTTAATFTLVSSGSGDAEPSSHSAAALPAPEPSTADGTTTSTGSDAETPLVDDCVKEVAAVAQVVASLDTSAMHWETHVGAQRDFVAKEISHKKAQSIWKSSAREGADDIVRHAREVGGAESFEGSCAKAEKDVNGAEGLSDCLERMSALDAARRAGEVVHEQWVRHLDLEKHSDEIPDDTYKKAWEGTVATAGDALKEYDLAHAAIKDTPTCS